MAEDEAARQRLVRQHALATEQQLFGKVAADAAQQRRRYAEDRRAVSCRASSSVNLLLVTGIGAVALIGPLMSWRSMT